MIVSKASSWVEAHKYEWVWRVLHSLILMPIPVLHRLRCKKDVQVNPCKSHLKINLNLVPAKVDNAMDTAKFSRFQPISASPPQKKTWFSIRIITT